MGFPIVRAFTAMPDPAELTPNWTHAGRVMRSVTHDVNNQLGAVLAYAELIALAPERHAETAQMAREIASAVRDSTTMLDTVAALVAHDSVTVETINLPDLLTRVVALFRFELDRGGSGIEVQFPREVCAFPGVRSRMVRAFVHTLRHAANHALASQPKAKVIVRVTHTPVDFRVEIETKGGGNLPLVSVFPEVLSEARDHLHYHHGDLTWSDPAAILEIPRDTRLIKPTSTR